MLSYTGVCYRLFMRCTSIWGRPVAERPDLEGIGNRAEDALFGTFWREDIETLLDYAAALEREAGEREEYYCEMFERQAAVVRHHTGRADDLAVRLAQAEREREAAREALEAAEAWITHVLGILAGTGHLAGRIPDADCRDDGRAIAELLAAALAAQPRAEGEV